MTFYVYILQCCDGSYYTGSTKDVEARMQQHQNGRGARYTKSHPPQSVVYREEFNSRSAAMKREREIKKLSHQQKETLIVEQSKK
ncbi:MAG: GIY-YIG nuclease family protein [Nitrososphaerota archaeon]|jgi:putative endonuclease|nr:GIY-YIG nuclease family protein [Nitrososphaerota archaeon]